MLLCQILTAPQPTEAPAGSSADDASPEQLDRVHSSTWAVGAAHTGRAPQQVYLIIGFWDRLMPGAHHVAELLHSPEGVEGLPLGALHQERHQSVSPKVIRPRLRPPAGAGLDMSADGYLRCRRCKLLAAFSRLTRRATA